MTLSGGQATLAKYGREFYQVIGRRGGRPHSLTIKDIEQRRSLEMQLIKKKEVGRPSERSLQTLRRLWALQRRACPPLLLSSGRRAG